MDNDSKNPTTQINYVMNKLYFVMEIFDHCGRSGDDITISSSAMYGVSTVLKEVLDELGTVLDDLSRIRALDR